MALERAMILVGEDNSVFQIVPDENGNLVIPRIGEIISLPEGDFANRIKCRVKDVSYSTDFLDADNLQDKRLLFGDIYVHLEIINTEIKEEINI